MELETRRFYETARHHPRRRRPAAARRPGRGGAPQALAPAEARLLRRRPARPRRSAPAPVRPASGPAGPGRADGRLRLDAGAAVRGRVCHPRHLEDVPGRLAAAIGAGISMGFAEALSDDGSLTGRGRPLARGPVCGLMTALGGLGHALPYLIPTSSATAMARGGGGRAGGDRLDPQSLHGYAVPARRLPGGRRRHPGVPAGILIGSA